ncbi:beta strand repeat-containing protein [Nitrosospira multiformis]|uniref:PEP-CTERM protein-sorting domain-containing protein n=1 Tax=Nitrosospira multiformis TaxID=1231 RepID=A0A1I7GP51_9PROT|nr:PEP-CTERM sorting domain-containing protein [Nitrosospira multiformis]SFU50262.1 PEP-CTERM protein-sorting domain-containing protein [Nitrosospira multiformis]
MKTTKNNHQGIKIESVGRNVFQILPIAAAMAASGVIQPAFAVDRTWFGGTGEFGVDTNWSPTGVPGSGDKAVINSGNSTLSINTAITSLDLLGGVLGGTGNLTLSGLSTWTGGSIRGAATTQFDGGLSITGGARKDIEDGRIINVGNTTWSGNTSANNNSILFNGGTINNTGTWNDANSFDSFMNHFNGTNTFNNSGTYNKQSGTLTTIEVTYNNTGTTNVNAGTMQLKGNGTHTGNFNIASGGTLDFNQGTHNLNNATTSGGGTLKVSGSESFSFVNVNGGTHSSAVLISGGNLQGADHTFTGAATWTGGSIRGAATTQFDGGLSITGGARKDIEDGRIINVGNTTWSGNTSANNNSILFNGGTINNTGTWNDANSFDSFMNHFNGTNTFNNSGTYNKQSGTLTTIEVTYNNTGTTNVNAGTMHLTNSFTNEGVIDVNAAAAFQVARASNTTFVNSGTGEIRGDGTVITPTLGLSNSGAINPGNGIGHLTIDGDLTQASGGVINFELASLSSFDQLTVTDDVTLGGVIDVGNLGYTPVVGDSFVVATFDERLNDSTFASVTHDFGSGVAFDVIYHEHDVTITVVPEPEQYALFLAGLGLMGVMARRRRNHIRR